jgi:hypothetical protein
MANIKHVGRMKANKAKILVVFKTLPNDPEHCLVVGTASLDDVYHNSIINLVESQQAQDTFEFGEILSIRYFPDGKPMLAALHQNRNLIRVPTKDVEMTPSTTTVISLDELNLLIAEQRGVKVEDLAITASSSKSEVQEIAKVKDLMEPAAAPEVKTDGVLSDTDLAKSYRSQADAMYKEAARLRKEADELDPPKKKTVKVSEEASA